MRILLARHGQTDWNAAGKIQGRADIPLNQQGRAQAAQLAQRIQAAGERVDGVYASPQKRAFETAAIAGAALGGLEPVAVEGLREISFGLWEGHAWGEIQTRWPEEYRRYCADRLREAPPEGESFGALLQRALPALTQLERGAETTALVVTHSGVIRALICHLTHTPVEKVALFSVPNADWIMVEHGIPEDCERWGKRDRSGKTP